MKLTLNGLKEKEQWEKAGVALPAYDIAAVAEETKKSPVWVHLEPEISSVSLSAALQIL